MRSDACIIDAYIYAYCMRMTIYASLQSIMPLCRPAVKFITSLPTSSGKGTKNCDEYDCLSVCLSARITRKPRDRTSLIFVFACDSGSILLCQRCDTSCTSSQHLYVNLVKTLYHSHHFSFGKGNRSVFRSCRRLREVFLLYLLCKTKAIKRSFIRCGWNKLSSYYYKVYGKQMFVHCFLNFHLLE